jgi:hypothetical protein
MVKSIDIICRSEAQDSVARSPGGDKNGKAHPPFMWIAGLARFSIEEENVAQAQGELYS